MKTDRVSFSGLLLFGLYGVFYSLRMPLGSLRQPEAGFFPLVLSGLLLCLSVIGLAASFKSNEGRSAGAGFWGDLRSPLKIVSSAAAAILFFESAGFLLVAVFFLAFLFFRVSGYRWWMALTLGIAGGGIAWVCFVRLLGVPLPGGILGF